MRRVDCVWLVPWRVGAVRFGTQSGNGIGGNNPKERLDSGSPSEDHARREQTIKDVKSEKDLPGPQEPDATKGNGGTKRS